MLLTIRDAKREDIPALCALEKECFSLPWSEAGFAEFFDNDCAHALVAEADGEICGYVGMYLILGEGEITNLAVSGKYRRCGAATALLDRLFNTEGLCRVLLDVRVSNTAARALYEKCGFKVDGIRRGFYSKPREDALLMSREI
ncbi:MAG: ribosomal protein S18-alanine N-acetyltransferase [Clostridia bacterium]|nr:ribosomal protein S18-alanine N-acetyltransferase [Clostridia bacterium]